MYFDDLIDKINALKDAQDDFYKIASFSYIPAGIFDESSGRFVGENENYKPIRIMYGATKAHTFVIRVKSGESNNFNDRSKFTELIFEYASKTYKSEGIRKMPKYEAEFTLGFVLRYEELLNLNTQNKLNTPEITKFIDEDMKRFLISVKNNGMGIYAVPSGKVDVLWNGNIPVYMESQNPPSMYTYTGHKKK